jgi:hypothetical protein
LTHLSFSVNLEAEVLPLETTQPAAFTVWFRDLMRGPVAPYGDYFDRLRESVESSAPVYHPCQ